MKNLITQLLTPIILRVMKEEKARQEKENRDIIQKQVFECISTFLKQFD